MMKRKRKQGRPEKMVRKDERIAARITRELYDALQKRAYEEQKNASIVMVEALMQYLNFKMPPRG